MTVVVLHDLGDPDGGARWRAAAPPRWAVPDLPGHGTTPALRTGHYEPMSVAAIARWTIGDDDDATLVGVRQNAHTAFVHAAAGDCRRIVVVDGLWGPWCTPADDIDALYATIRSIADDAASTAPAPPAGLDPRATHGYGLIITENFAKTFWGVIECPLLAIETPASTTPASERLVRLSWFGGQTELVELDTDDPVGVVGAITAWL